MLVQGELGFGVILRYAKGEILACLCENIEYMLQPIIAEALALRRVMEFA